MERSGGRESAVHDGEDPRGAGEGWSSGDGRRRRWDTHRAGQRSRILDGAVDLVKQAGPELAVEQLAGRVGVSKPVIYRLFGDRDGLLAAITERMVATLLEEAILPAVTSDGGPRARIGVAFDAFTEFISRNPELYRFAVRGETASVLRVVDRNKAALAGVVEAVVVEGLLAMTVGDVDATRVATWARGVIGFGQQSSEWWLEEQPMSREEFVGHATELVWAQVDALLRSFGVELDPDEPLELDVPAPRVDRDRE